MATAVDRFLFGLCFGMGLAISLAVLRLVAGLLSQGAAQHPLL
jgi:hypothetical protein